MSSQPSSTPTQGYKNGPRRRSLFGPLLLISIGIIFLLRQLGMLGQLSLWDWFANWWPLLLILWGMIRLVDWYLARRDGAAPPSANGGTVVLIVFLVIFGLAASGIHQFLLTLPKDDPDLPEFLQHLEGESHAFNESVQQEFTPGALLRVNNMQGDISVSTSPDGMLHVAARNVIYGSDAEATRLEAEAKPTITREGEVYVVRGSNNNRVRSILEIELPQKATLDVSTNHGKISVTDILGNVHAYTGHGDVSLENLGGDASVDIHGGLVSAHKVLGVVSITGRVETVDASDTGSVSVSGEYLGSMTTERIQKTVRFHSTRSEMEFGNVRGRVFIGPSEVEGDDIGGPIQVRTEAKNIRLENFSGDLSIQDSDGEIELTPATVGAIAVTNHNESINLLLPENANVTLAAHTSGEGEISSEFPSLKTQSSGKITHLNGNIGAGGTTVTLETDNAAIEIRKGIASEKKKAQSK